MGMSAGMFSRRDFIEAAGAAGALLAGSAAVAAHADEAAPEAAPEAGQAQVAMPAIEVIDCDTLIIGGGLNGTHAAAQIAEEGGMVTIVDKGPWRHSGLAGVSVDLFNFIGDFRLMATAVYGSSFLVNSELVNACADFHTENQTVLNYMVNHGEMVANREEDGTLKSIPGNKYLTQGLFFRREQDYLDALDNVTVYDRTMITELLVNDGKCVGAMGIYLPTGTLRVFRAKATVSDTGGCVWFYGWQTVTANTCGYVENDSAVPLSAWRHGCGIGEAEFPGIDTIGIYPSSLAMGNGSNIDIEPADAKELRDKDGNFIFTDEDVILTGSLEERRHFAQTLARVVYEEGRGTEHEGGLLRLGTYEPTRRMCSRNIPLFEKFGLDTSNLEIEMLPDMYDHGGEPLIDTKMMTELPGLFDGRGATANGRIGGAWIASAYYYGPYVGHCAHEYAQAAEALPEIDLSSVIAEYDRLNAIRTFATEDSVTPFQVRRAIQEAGLLGMSIYRTEERMNEALAMVADIRENMLPRMAIRDSSPTYNMEWKQAIEAFNILDILEISIRASLERKETRGDYIRGDYPEMDDENWFCTLLCYNRDGEMEFVKHELPEYVPYDSEALTNMTN